MKSTVENKVNIIPKELVHISSFKALPKEVFEVEFTQNNSFWSSDYFKTIEEICGVDFEQHWLLHYSPKGDLAAALSFQVFQFSGRNYQFEFNCKELGDFAPELGKCLMKYLIRPFSLKVLLVGNAFTTGSFSLLQNTELISAEAWVEMVEKWQWEVFLKERTDIGAVLWKDFNSKELADFKFLENRDYLKFEVQPTMILDLPNTWNSFEDYLAAMQSRYRTRMRKVFKKGEEVQARWLDAEEIKANIDKMESLYMQVVAPSNFKMTTMPVSHLWKLAENANTGFKVLGFFAPEGMIGFISFYRFKEALYAGYMGIDRETQMTYDQYLRTLLELIKAGIEQDFKSVYFGRTAMEIKSSTGAVPENLYLFAKHRNKSLNAMLKPLVLKLCEQEEWNQRHPFKD